MPGACTACTAARGGRRPRPGIVVHRCTTLTAHDITEHDGFPVTSVARTLLDLATTLRPGPLERAVERSLILRRFDLRAVTDVLERNPTSRGATPLSKVIATVHDDEVDFLWRGHRLIAETDGHEHHGTRTAFERDRARDAHLTALGYRVVRFTYRQVVHQPDYVASTLLALLRAPVSA